MKRIGVIEIGANSVTLTLNEVEEDGYFRPIDELNTSIRLCQDLVDGTEISEEKLNITLSTLRVFKSMCQVSGAEKIIAIATESFRSASNSDSLISLIKAELGIDITILNIEKEIYYNFLGVSNTIYFNNSLIVDIEGTATHLAWVKDGEIVKYHSLPAGTLNLTTEYNLGDRILREDLEAAVSNILELLNDCPWLKECKFDSIIGVGGTIKCLGQLDRIRKRYPFGVAHNYTLNDIDVHDIYNLLKCKSLKQRKMVDGLPRERADIIVAGLCIFQNILTYTNTSDVITSSRGLREGIMYEYVDTKYGYDKDMLSFSIEGIINKLNINRNHAKHVYLIAQKLYEELRPLHKLDSRCPRILRTASLLHDCGISIDYYNHHKHSFYVILNSCINGLTHKELFLSAAVAASHRNNHYHIPFPQFCSVINKIDVKTIEYMGAILRISEGLDRSLEGAVKDINVIISTETVKLELKSDLNLELEIRQAMRSAYSFKEIFNRNLLIDQID
ncbi:Ppx/GppA phosphatase family protein [Clostridium sp.]|uniref:Ppx/GppA phosphatase family protein n=1 Tax=Clostridium sp. TaxID=1506 RepID=UPI002FC99183